jgi:hypothetical protein
MKVVWLVAVVLGLAAGQSSAQERTFAIEGTGGYVGFAEDGGIAGHSLIGAAARWYALPRISIGPEIQFMAWEGDHRDLMVTGNVTVDLIERHAGHRAIPYLVVGGGLFQTRNTFRDDTVTSSEGGFTAGGGVRVFAGSFYVAPEFRYGWEPHFRLSVSVGYPSR